MSIQITPKLLRKWGSCYSDEKHERIFAIHGSGFATPIIIAGWKDVPAKDRLWVLLHEDVLSKKEIQHLALSFARHVLPIWMKPYPDDLHIVFLLETIGKFLVDDVSQEDALTAKRAAYASTSTAVVAYASAAASYASYVAAASAAASYVAASAYTSAAAYVTSAADAAADADADAAGAYAADADAAGAYAADADAAGAYAADAEQKWQIAEVVKMLQKRKERDSNAKI